MCVKLIGGNVMYTQLLSVLLQSQLCQHNVTLCDEEIITLQSTGNVHLNWVKQSECLKDQLSYT